jgi:fatty-acyl-CoA synthase
MQPKIRNLADVEAIEQAPLESLGLAENVYAAITEAAAHYPNRVAIHGLSTGAADEEPASMTYADFLDALHRTANLFGRLGVGAEDAVTLLLPVTADAVVCMWAAGTAGIANPVNSFLEVDHLESIMRAAGTKVLVAWHPSVSPSSWEKAEILRQRLPDVRVVQCGGDGHAPEGVVVYEQAIASEPGDRLIAPRTIVPTDVVAYLHTGGTTGLPKLARHSHRGQLLQCKCMDLMQGSDDQLVQLLGVPLFHVGGAIIGSLAALIAGGTVVMLHPNGLRDPVAVRDYLKNATRFGATRLGNVPAVWAALLGLPMDGVDLSTVRNGIVAAASVPAEMAAQAEAKYGFPLLEGWGMTEVHGFASLNPLAGENRNGSIGLRFPYMQVRIAQVDADGNWQRDCGTNEIGVLLVKGPQVIAGYVDEAHNAAAWIDGDWLNTGDLARMDADGYLWHVGRAKDLIIRGGHNIDPVLIEEVLYQYDGVELAAAVGRPDRRVGEMPVAYVQMRAGAAFDADALADFVRPRIQERAAMPVSFHALDEMPLTPVGKIFKPALRMDAIERVFSAELSALAGPDESIGVTVSPDKVHGTLATVTVHAGSAAAAQDLALRCRDMLTGYSVRSDVTIAGI